MNGDIKINIRDDGCILLSVEGEAVLPPPLANSFIGEFKRAQSDVAELLELAKKKGIVLKGYNSSGRVLSCPLSGAPQGGPSEEGK